VKNDLDLSYKGIFLFSLPTIFATILEPLAGMVDTALIGNFNTRLLAELALAATLMTSFTWIFNFLIHAPLQTVASAIGKTGGFISHKEEVQLKVRVSLIICFAVGVISLGILIFGKSLLYQLMGVSNELLQGVDEYFVIRLVGHPFTLLFQSCLSLLRAFGKVNEGFVYILASTILNILLSYTFIYHFDLGIAGAAWGTVISQVLGFLLAFMTLNKCASLKWLDWKKGFTWAPEYLTFGKKSLNIFLRSFFLTSAFFLATKLSAKLDLASISAHQIMTQFWLTLAALMDGLSVSASVYCARFSESGNKESLRSFIAKIVRLSIIIGLFFSLLFFLGKGFFMELYTKDPEVIFVLASLWLIMILVQPLNALTFILDGIMFGLGRFAYLRSNMMIAVALFFFPFAYYSWSKGNLMAIWIGFCLINLWRSLSNSLLLKRLI
jgi:multidrug resistance protein, MATE family